MKIGDLVKIKADSPFYKHAQRGLGIIVTHRNEGIGVGGAWILWSNELEPKLFGRLDFLEVINESR